MTKFMLAATALAALATTPALAQTKPVMIVVDQSRILAECNACKTAQAALKVQADALQARLQSLAAPLQTEAQSLQTAAGALKGKPADAPLQARIAAFQQKQQSFQQEQARAEDGFRRNQQYVLQQVGAKLNPIVNATLKARGALTAVDASQVIAFDPSLEVTNDVMTQLNAQLPSVSTTAPAAPATPRPAGR